MKIIQVTEDEVTIPTNTILKRKADDILGSLSIRYAKKNKPSNDDEPSAKRSSPVTVAPSPGALWQQEHDDRRPVVSVLERQTSVPVVDMSALYSERTAPTKKPALKSLLSSLEPVLHNNERTETTTQRIEAECLVFNQGVFTGVAIHWIWVASDDAATQDKENSDSLPERRIEWRQEWIGDLPEEYQDATPKAFPFQIWLDVLTEMTQESSH